MHKPQETEPDYKQMYLELCRAQLQIMDILAEAHRKAEEIYMSAGEETEERAET